MNIVKLVHEGTGAVLSGHHNGHQGGRVQNELEPMVNAQEHGRTGQGQHAAVSVVVRLGHKAR